MKTSTDLVRAWGIIAALGLFNFGCAASSQGTEPPSSQANATPAAPTASASASQEPAEKPEAKGPELVYTLADAGFAAPEAVLYDEEADVYYVSNVNGDPSAEDGNGFISKVGPDGKIQELKWIDGQKKGSTLNAPKGMAVSKGFLYVSDITWVRIFDRKTGEPKGKILAKGATFLNGVAVSEEGEVVFSDTGWKSGKDGFSTTGSDALYRVDPKTVAAKDLVRGKDLGNPNGIASTKDGLWVVNDQGELFLVGKDGKKGQATKLAKGGLDGVVALDDGRFLVSSWKAEAIYQGKPGAEFEVLLGDLKSPASIGYDSKRGRILVPKMMENQVLIYDLAPKPQIAAVPAPAVAPAPAAAAPSGQGEPAKADKPAPTAEKPNEPKMSEPKGKPAESAKSEPQKKPSPAATPAEPAKSAPPDSKTPAAQTKSTVPAKAAEPAKPATPAKSTAQTKSAVPAQPAEPAKPAAPAKSAEPAKPAAPAKSAEPAKPAAPAKSVEPAKPAAPAAK